MIQVLIFDFDGLILDTETSLVAGWQDIYDEYNLEVPVSQWAEMLGHAADPPQAYEYLEAHLGEAVDRDALRLRRLTFELEYLQGQDAMPGVRELILQGRDGGLVFAIASSSEHDWVDGHLERLGLIDHFDLVICADDVEATKPEPDLYLRVLQELGRAPAEAIALEDSAHGVTAAKAAGIYCIAVPNAITRLVRLDHADCVLETLEGATVDDLISYASSAS